MSLSSTRTNILAIALLLVAATFSRGQTPIHSISVIGGPSSQVAESTIIPDIDADGHDDLLIRHAAQTRIFSGRTGAVLRTLAAGASSFGHDAAVAGDIDLDGTVDLIIADHTTYPQLVRVFSGATGAVLRTINDPSNIFGYSVAGVGDLNNDGIPDLAVGAPFSNVGGSLSGRVFVYSGANGALLMLLPGTAANEQLGLVVAAAGDVNLDGKPDILVTGTSDSLVANGVVRIYSGANGAVLLSMTGTNNFGYSAASAGDINGDGRPDFLIGAPTFGTGGAGRVQLRSGLDGSVLLTMNGDAGSRFGTAVGKIGDVDGDGMADYVVGAPGSLLPTGGLTGAKVQIRSGANGSMLSEIIAPVIGFEIGRGGDVDADGKPDFTVNEWSASQVLTTRVYSTAFFNANPLPGTGDDLTLESTLDGAFATEPVKFATVGNALALRLASPMGTLQPFHNVLAAQAIVTTQGVVSDPGFPTIHFNLAAAIQPVVLHDSTQGFFFTPGLPAGGLDFFVGYVPAGFGGLSVILQGFSLAGPAAANGIFAATDAHEIRMPF